MQTTADHRRPDLLLLGPLLPHTMAQLEATYALHRYDLAPVRTRW